MAGLERRRRRAPVQSVEDDPLNSSRRVPPLGCCRTRSQGHRAYVRASRSAAILMVAKVENVSEIA